MFKEIKRFFRWLRAPTRYEEQILEMLEDWRQDVDERTENNLNSAREDIQRLFAEDIKKFINSNQSVIDNIHTLHTRLHNIEAKMHQEAEETSMMRREFYLLAESLKSLPPHIFDPEMIDPNVRPSALPPEDTNSATLYTSVTKMDTKPKRKKLVKQYLYKDSYGYAFKLPSPLPKRKKRQKGKN